MQASGTPLAGSEEIACRYRSVSPPGRRIKTAWKMIEMSRTSHLDQ